MKNYFLASVALAAFSASAMAADLPTRAAAPAPVYAAPVYSWQGFYVGATAGYARSSNQADYSYGVPVDSEAAPLIAGALAGGYLPTRLGSKNNGGFTGGVTAGYNFQSGSFVYGVEADVQSLKTKSSSFASGDMPGTVQIRPQIIASTPTGSYSDDTVSFGAGTKGSANWLGTLRARAGIAFDRALVYGTGGLAFGGVKSKSWVGMNLHCQSVDCSDPNNDLTAIWSGSDSKTKFGWALGAGIEYAISNSWSLKGEYLHYDLGKVSYALSPANSDAALITDNFGVEGAVRTKVQGDLFRIGLNYKFGGPAPVVAKY